jgi:O-antigen/teichoic acid export membrane protein
MQEVVRGASIAFVLKILAAGLGFTFNVVLARLLGAEGAGLYFLALTVTSIAALVGRVGLDNALVRFTAANAAIEDWVAVKGLYIKGIKFALVSSSLVALIVVLAASSLSNVLFSQPELTSLIRWMAIAIVPVSLYTLYAHLLKGLKRILDAISVLSIWLPVFSLMGTIVMAPYWGVLGAIWAYILATVTTLAIGYRLWHKATPHLRNLVGCFDTVELLNSSMPLFWMGCLHQVTIWSSTLMLGIWGSPADVGIFGVANRTSILISFVLIAVNSIAAPKFAALYRRGEIEALGHTARSCTKLMTLMAAPALLLFLLAPGRVMGIFGPEFIGGGLTLSILAVGQFVNVVTGSVGFVLIMTGNEHLMRNNIAFCALTIVILNYILIPIWGAVGAAIASAITLILQNITATILVWRKHGLWTLPFVK